MATALMSRPTAGAVPDGVRPPIAAPGGDGVRTGTASTAADVVRTRAGDQPLEGRSCPPGRPRPGRQGQPAARPVRAPSSRTPAGGHQAVRPRVAPRVRGGLGVRPSPVAPEVGMPRGLRLTRRGRVVLLAVLVLVLSAAFALGRVGAHGSTAAPAPVRVGQMTVQPGDTLWDIAGQLAPGQDVRPVVEQLRRLNRLEGDSLHEGQLLLLPQRG